MSSFTSLYDDYEQPVYRFLLSLTGDPLLAEELLQETFYQAFLHIDQFEGRSQLLTWLCQIGKNAWLKECRRNQRRCGTLSEALDVPDPAPSPEEQMVKKAQLQQITNALAHLNEPYKEVFILHIYGQLPLKEIARLHGKSESWARVTYYRARTQLSKEVMK